MLEKLNEEQEQLLEGFADKWIDIVYNTKTLNKEKFEEGVNWIYTEILKLDKPTIVYCQSVVEASFRAASAYNKTENPTEEQIKEARSKCSHYSSLPLSAHWVANYDYYHQIGVVDHENFKKFRDYVLSGVFTAIEFEKAIFVVCPPEKWVTNENKILHNTEGYAIQFTDGTGDYYLQGRAIPNKYFEKIRDKSLTIEEFLAIENEEHKSACILAMQELHNETYVADFFKKFLSEVNTFVDKKAEQYLKGTTVERGEGMNIGVYTLFKGKLKLSNDEDSEEDEIAYVRCYCPSTDRMFFLGCEPHHTEAKDAIASLYRVPRGLENNIKYIQRQGEIFSTVFDEEGLSKIKSYSEEQLRDTVTISGDRYFSLMRYEY